MHCARPLGVARDFGDLPRRQIGIDVLGEAQALLVELVDFFADIDGALVLHVAQFFDLVLKLRDGLLEVKKGSFGQHGLLENDNRLMLPDVASPQ